jgi:hypothetical protein
MMRSNIITDTEEKLESEMVMNKFLTKSETSTSRNKKAADDVNAILKEALEKLRKL